MKGTRAAQRYARSFLQFAIEQKVLDKVRADMELLHKLIHENKELELLLKSPVIKTDKKTAIFNALLKGNVDKVTLSFVTLITNKKREALLGQIASRFLELYKEYKGILTAEVVSATELGDKVRQQMLDLIRDSARSEVDLVEKVDKDLIGGFIIKVGDKQYNASVAHKLNELRKTFRENPFVKDF